MTVLPTETNEFVMGFSKDPMAIRLIIENLTKLYTDPILSGARETISNAIDATVKIAPQLRKPIIITLPKTDNLFFTVEDFGVGMSSQELQDNFASYGGSNKRNDADNSQTGSYGLGAKAPLAYNKSFHVESTKDGVTTTLTCSFTDEGYKGHISDGVKTGKPNGTKVTIPVKNNANDLLRFSEVAEKYTMAPKDVQLIIDGVPVKDSNLILFDEFTLDISKNLKGRVWLSKKEFHKYMTKLLHNDYSSLNYDFILSGWNYGDNNYHGAYSVTFTVELKPGVVNFSTSRDSIVNDETFANLRNRLTENYTPDYHMQLDKKKRAELLEKVFKVYRSSFDTAEAVKTLSVFEQNFSFDSTNRTVSRMHHSEALFSFDEFTISNGFNAMDNYIKNCSGSFIGNLTLITEKDVRTNTNHKLHVANSNNYAGIVNSLSSVKNFLTQSASFANPYDRTIVNAIMDLHLKADERDGNSCEHPYIIENCDENFISKFFNNRKLFMEEWSVPNARKVEIFFMGDKVSDEDLKLIKLLSPSVELIDSASAYEIIEAEANRKREIRKEQRKQKAAETFTVSVKEISAQDNFKTLFNDVDGYYYKTDRKTITLEDIRNQNGILLLKTRNSYMPYSKMLIGLSNEGLDILNRNIYVGEIEALSSTIAQELLSYEHSYVRFDKTASSKAAKELVAKRSPFGEKLEDELSTITIEDILLKEFSQNSYRYERLICSNHEAFMHQYAKLSSFRDSIADDFMRSCLDNILEAAYIYDMNRNKNSNNNTFVSSIGMDDLTTITSKRKSYSINWLLKLLQNKHYLDDHVKGDLEKIFDIFLNSKEDDFNPVIAKIIYKDVEDRFKDNLKDFYSKQQLEMEI